MDREALARWLSDVLVMDEAGRRVFDWWCDHPRLFAVLFGGYVGFITGALCAIIMGTV